MSPPASTAVDLARVQFATTSLYYFLFVPLTLGLAPLVAVMQTIWHRTGDEAWRDGSPQLLTRHGPIGSRVPAR